MFFFLCVGAVKKIFKKLAFFLIFGPACGAHGWYSHEFHNVEIPTFKQVFIVYDLLLSKEILMTLYNLYMYIYLLSLSQIEDLFTQICLLLN